MGFIPVRKAFKAQDDSSLTIKVLKLQLKIFSVAVAADLICYFHYPQIQATNHLTSQKTDHKLFSLNEHHIIH